MREKNITRLDITSDIHYPFLPKEIWIEILTFVIQAGPLPIILKLNLVAKFTNAINNHLSQALLKERYGQYTPHIFSSSQMPSYSVCFFKFTQQEATRLSRNCSWSKNIVDISSIQDNPSELNYNLIQKTRLFLSKTIDQQTIFDFSKLEINDRGCFFPANLWKLIEKMVNMHAYENLQNFYSHSLKNNDSKSELLLDTIYLKAAESYSPFEMAELQAYLPVDLNKPCAYLINGVGRWSTLEAKSLITTANEFNNKRLISYLQTLSSCQESTLKSSKPLK